MIGSFWQLLLVGTAVASISMAFLWAIQVRIRDASHVDAGWAIPVRQPVERSSMPRTLVT